MQARRRWVDDTLSPDEADGLGIWLEAPAPPHTAGWILALVHRFLLANNWVVIEEVIARDHDQAAPGRRIDALAARAASGPHHGQLERLALEVKCARGDFLNDIRRPEKQAPWRALSHGHVFVVPAGLVNVDEVGERSGLLEVFDQLIARQGHRRPVLRWTKPHPPTAAPGLPDWLVLDLARRASTPQRLKRWALHDRDRVVRTETEAWLDLRHSDPGTDAGVKRQDSLVTHGSLDMDLDDPHVAPVVIAAQFPHSSPQEDGPHESPPCSTADPDPDPDPDPIPDVDPDVDDARTVFDDDDHPGLPEPEGWLDLMELAGEWGTVFRIGSKLQWYQYAWSLLQDAGLTSWSDELARAEVLGRLAALTAQFKAFQARAQQLSATDSWEGDALELTGAWPRTSVFTLGRLVEHLALDLTDRDDLESVAGVPATLPVALVRHLTPVVVQALEDRLGHSMLSASMYAAASCNLRYPLGAEQLGGFTRISDDWGGKMDSYNWVSDGMPL